MTIKLPILTPIFFFTLSGREVLWIIQVQSVESSAARLPPPSSLQHRCTIQAWSIVIPSKRINEFKYNVFGLGHCMLLYHIPVVSREWTVIASVPWVVQRISGISFVTINLQLVVLRFRINFEMWVLSISETHTQ